MITAVVLNPDGYYEAKVTKEVTKHTYAWSTGTDWATFDKADKIAKEYNALETEITSREDKFYKTCGECYGEGEIEVMYACGKPLSECCGGCTQDAECRLCNGSGEILLDIEQVPPHLDPNFKTYEF